ncbi:MAG TPA: hypothetical protein VFB21_15045 [Chthonomonadaceae bacterium]|jgi:hypothetical protein|nr:hypothetical protein [Chthonomonadaceae bacterium]
MDRRIAGAVIALAVIVVGLVFWFQYRETASHTIAPFSAKQMTEKQIEGIQNSNLPPEQKEAQIARIRAFTRNLKK